MPMACKLQSRIIDTSCLESGQISCISLEKISIMLERNDITSQMLDIILRSAKHDTDA